MIDREKRGRFVPGTSGNPGGRPKKEIVRLETMEDLDNIILEIANRMVPVDSGSGLEAVSLFAYSALTLMTGKAPNRLAAKASIEIIQHAAVRSDRRRREDQKDKRRAVLQEMRRNGQLNQYLDEHGPE